MKITIRTYYRTNWGETLRICGKGAALGGDVEDKAPAMTFTSPDCWTYTYVAPRTPKTVEFRFLLTDDSGRVLREEWGAKHCVEVAGDAPELNITALWKDIPSDKPFYSSAFTDGILKREGREAALTPAADMLRITVEAPTVRPDEVVAICGNAKALGTWNPADALRCSDADFPYWTAQIPLEGLPADLRFKFLILNKKDGALVDWENCGDRYLFIGKPEAGSQVVAGNYRLASPLAPWRGAGTAIPVFSIRTDADFGVGDFLDIKEMADWCAHTGQCMLQVLPINDTTMTGTWVDSYPYKANSTFALHPMFVRPQAAGMLADASQRERFEALRAELNALPAVDYERVNAAKDEYMRLLYAQERKHTTASSDYKDFIAANKEWLRPYAAWRVLRSKFGTPDNAQWGEYAVYDADRVERFCKANQTEVGFYYFVQYHLDRQLREARDYARSKGVVLKGDIPIGISRTSVDAWMSPRLFNLNSQAGAPPDDFSVLGQNWGFPTYNWEEMSLDGFAWWKSRFAKMAEYFDAYRIDHILGFFRIWQIPETQLHGLLGVFNPALPFTAAELRDSYGFNIRPEVQTHPLVLDWTVAEEFGENADRVKAEFLVHQEGDEWRLRPEVDTQKKVAALFATLDHTPENDAICQGLLNIIDDVLFIEDPYRKGHYHPRIAAQHTRQYRYLSDYDKGLFNKLYNDFFYRRNDDFWRSSALWKLPPLLDSTGMLACAEDLGMIPACVPDVMKQLEILSLEIQRMPKDPSVEFANTWGYPYYSVCTTSTHDMAGIRAWWESDPAKSQRFFGGVLHQHGGSPFYAEPWICDKIVDLQLLSPSMLCILPLQDWLSIDGVLRRKDPREEQINEPSNPMHYWRYRMHLTVGRLMADHAFNDAIAARIEVAARR